MNLGLSGNIQQNGFENSAWRWSPVISSMKSVNKSARYISQAKKTKVGPVDSDGSWYRKVSGSVS